MNVLARMIIPKLDLTVRYTARVRVCVLSELEELEREDTFRLKRVKEKKMKKVKKVQEDGAGEQIKVANDKELKKEEAPNAELVEKAKPGSDDKETSIMAQPKEAAGMGDLIIIKPSDEKMEVGDTFIPPPQLKTMGTFTEVEKLMEGISNFDEKKKDEKQEESQPDDKHIEVDKDVTAGNLETGEWFETPSKSEIRANLNNTQVSEYSKMDEYKEIIGYERNTDTKSTDLISLKADESIVDLDKRALASLYKGIDSNFYLPTTDDIFSKNDIAIRDVSLRDILVIEYSLVDLESIDFSIDSKGKVVFSKNDTGQSLPVPSKHQDTDFPKSESKYDEDGILTDSTSRLASVQWLGDGLTEVNELKSQFKPAVERERVEESLQYEPTMTGTGKTNSVKNTNKVKLNTDNRNDDENELDESQESLSFKRSNPNITDNLHKKTKVSLEETEVWTSDTEQIPISEELKTERISEEEIREIKFSESISNKKLSRISEEDNLGAVRTSKLSEMQMEDEKDIEGSVISDKFEDSMSSFHDNNTLLTSKEKVLQSGISSNKKEQLDSNTNDLEEKIEETAGLGNEIEETLEKTSKQPGLKIDEVQEGNLKKVRSVWSSIDLRSNNNINQDNVRNKPHENKFSQNVTQNEDMSEEANIVVQKTDHKIVQESNTETSQDSRRTTEQIDESKSLLWRDTNFIIEGNNKNRNLTEPTEVNSQNNISSETKDKEYEQQPKEHSENKPLRILDSDETIEKKDREQLKSNSKNKTDTTYSEAKRESQDNQTETEQSRQDEMNKKSLRILSSGQIVRSNEEYKRKSKDNQGKESEKDKDKNMEQKNPDSDSERGSSDVSRRGKHSGDDHEKQED